MVEPNTNTGSGTPAEHGPPTAEYFVDQIVQHRPAWFGYKVQEFRGDRNELHSRILQLLQIQKSAKVRAHVGMVLLCMGHPAGAEELLNTLRGADDPARSYAVGELSAIWHAVHARIKRGEIPISAADVAQALESLLANPESPDGSLALEFCLQYACHDAMPFTRRYLEHPDEGLRCKVASAYLRLGIDQGALAAASAHWLGPLPVEPEALKTWRNRAERYAAPLLQHPGTPVNAPSIPILPETVVPLAMQIIKKTLSGPETPARTWFNVDHRTGQGYFNTLLRVVANAKSAYAAALLQEIVSCSTVAPYSRANAALLFVQASGHAPEGADAAIARMVQDQSVSEWGRGPMLKECAGTLGAHALDGLLLALQDKGLRDAAADSVKSVPLGERSDEVRSALQAAMANESRDWVRTKIATTLVSLGNFDDAIVNALDPWDAMDFRWRQRKLTVAEAVRQLTEAGAIDPLTDEKLAAIKYQDGWSLILELCAVGKEASRLTCPCVRSDIEPRPSDMFEELARIARPPLQVESVSQTCHQVEQEQERDAASAGLMMWQDGEWKPTPEHLVAGIPLVTIGDTIWTVHYSYRGQKYSFACRPRGWDLDVETVYQAFNALMKQEGREDRAFRLADAKGSHGAYAMFVCAKDVPFRRAAENLYIPLTADKNASD